MGSAYSEHIRPYHAGPRLGPVRPIYRGYYPPPRYYHAGWPYWAAGATPAVVGLTIAPQEDIEGQLARYAGRQGIIRDKNGITIGTFVLEIAPGVLNIVTEIGGKTVSSSGSYVKEGTTLRMVSFGQERQPAEVQYDGAASIRFNEIAFRLWRAGDQPLFLSWQ